MPSPTNLKVLVAVMFTALVGIATWWVNEVNSDRKLIHALHYRSMYLDGVIPAAPLPPNAPRKAD